METLEALGGPELNAISTIWVAQKRSLVAAFGGTSMSPTIAPGQKVLLQCGVMPRVGEIAAYILEDQLAVHRVVRSDDRRGWLMTWGDGNPLPDDPVDDWKRIVGTVSRIERDGAMQQIPPGPSSLRRTLILRLAAPPTADRATVRRRLSLLYRVR